MKFLNNCLMYYRIAGLVTWTSIIFITIQAIRPVGWFSEPIRRRMRQAIVRAWGKGCWKFMGLHAHVVGTPPKNSYFLVANHLTYVDTFLLSGVLGCTFVARHDVADWPFIGMIARNTDIIFVNRLSRRDAFRVNDAIGDAIAQGESVAMHAESHTSRGLTVNPFKSALLEPAARGQWPVYCATIHYESLPGMIPASEYVVWWREEESFFFHIARLLKQKGFAATVTFSEKPIQSDDRKVLADLLWREVSDRFTPID
jgi:1-acyl-sn-glycerol-3-phosphate acyltransferase